MPALFDGDSYLVRLADGSELWASYVRHRGAHFVPCDDENNPVGEPLDNVVAVHAVTDRTRKYFEED